MLYDYLNRESLSAAIKKAPALGDILRKLASKAARGLRIPETFSVRGLDYDAQRELEHLFGTVGQRVADGRYILQIHEFLLDPNEWRDAIEFFGLAPEDKESDRADVFRRLKLLLPCAAEALDILAQKDEVTRFVADKANGKSWMKLFRHVVEQRLLRDDRGPITLSQLGSDCLGDSKKLRSGPLRRQLVMILAALYGQDPADERLVLDHAQIIDNPYTSAVTFSAPVRLRLKDGATFDYPEKYFSRHMAVQLPLETVLEIDSVEWVGQGREVTTSENAAPFAMLVESGAPAVYTAGYPVMAVKAFLCKLAEAGIECAHEGDADLDGFIIAGEVAGCIPVVRVAAADALARAKADDGIPLAMAQSVRAHFFLERHPDFRYADDVRRLMARGRWIEQESFGKISTQGQ